MALNKRKVLDAAQKYLQKGSLDKALKEYQKVLDADPKDSNVRLKVGDVQLRLGNGDAAIESYLEVAKLFMKKGFDAKAVALFKQITKIDEKRYDIYEPLAELYQRLGLTSEAMQALQAAAEAHQREGRKKEGLALLRKMASLDPSNTSTRMKIAEMLWKADLHDDALAEYDEVIAELGRQGDHENAVRVHEQVLRNRPERLENLIGLGLAHLELKRPEKADVPLLKATEVAVDSIEAWEGLAHVHEALGRRKDLEDAWKTVAAIYKDRGNEEKAKEILQLYVSPHGLTEDGEQEFDEETGGVTLGDLGADPEEELEIGSAATTPPTAAPAPPTAAPAPTAAAPAPTAAVENAPDVDLDDEIEIELDEEVEVAADRRESSLLDADADGSAADADPAQLLAEAGVYLRYSQHDKAVSCLERILEQDPGHLEALEKLGEARQAMGDANAAVALWKEAADYARQGGNQEAFDALCERVRSIDEGAAESLAADALAPNLDEPTQDPDLDIELEFDTPSGEPELTGEVSSLDLEIDLLDSSSPDVPDLDLSLSAVNVDAPAEEAPPERDAPTASDDSSDLSARFDVPAGGVRIDGSESGEVPAEDLEEAEFYYRQGLLDEAEQILKRLLAVAPGHPQVLLRLGEIAKSRGENPSTPVTGDVDFDRTEDDTQPGIDASPPERDASPPERDASPPERDASQPGIDALPPERDASGDSTVEDLGGKPSVGEPPAGPDDETVQVDAADIDDVEFDDDDDEDEGGATLGGDTVPNLRAAEEGAASAAAPATDDDDMSGEGFDLAAELEDVFDGPAGNADEDEAGGTTQAGFQSIFQSFKAGVKEALGEGEYETHYDLGIAYREMGLLDDAIGEFAAALPSPTRKLDCLAMMGLCALDVGRAADAVAHFEQALAMPDLDDGRMAGLRFDLGRAFAMQGDWGRTRELWEQVKAFDPAFQDVAAKLEDLADDSSPSLGRLAPAEPAGEALESFDDLIAEAESGFDDDEDDDSDGGPDGSGGDDTTGGPGSSKWGGRKISYG